MVHFSTIVNVVILFWLDTSTCVATTFQFACITYLNQSISVPFRELECGRLSRETYDGRSIYSWKKKVVLVWVFGHGGISCNEYASKLAEEHAVEKLFGPKPLCSSKMHKLKHLDGWKVSEMLLQSIWVEAN